MIDNGDINIESIYNKSYHCMNAIAIQRLQYPVLSDSTESPPCSPRNMILKTRHWSLKPVIESIEPAIKKVRSDSSLVSNMDIIDGLTHEAVAITEDLLWCILRKQASFYCHKQIIPTGHKQCDITSINKSSSHWIKCNGGNNLAS